MYYIYCTVPPYDTRIHEILNYMYVREEPEISINQVYIHLSIYLSILMSVLYTISQQTRFVIAEDKTFLRHFELLHLLQV